MTIRERFARKLRDLYEVEYAIPHWEGLLDSDRDSFLSEADELLAEFADWLDERATANERDALATKRQDDVILKAGCALEDRAIAADLREEKKT